MTTENFLFGEVVGFPLLKFVNPNKQDGKCDAGFEIRFLTNSAFEGGENVLDVLVVYDLMNWDIMKPGQWLKLSVKQEQDSSTSPSGKVIKCNVVFRK
jgi:hypothetical protein